MQKLWRLALVVGVTAVILIIAAGSNQRTLAFVPPSSAFGAAQIAGPISVDVIVDPPIVQPGDAFTVQLTLTNASSTLQTPEIQFDIPSQIVLTSTELPSGMTVNTQSAHVDWLPVLRGGQSVAHTLHFQAVSADLVQPEQAIGLRMLVNEQPLAVDVRFWLGIAPQIEQVVLPQRVAVGQPVPLRARLDGSGPFTQSWQLGDGRTVNVNDPVVSFPFAGEYELTLTAENPLTSVTQTKKIFVVAQPAAQFTASDLSISANQPISFVNQSGGNGPLETQWDFGDGTTSTEANPTHSYAQPGTYQVHLTVRNAHGRSEAYETVTVGAPPAVALQLPQESAAGDIVKGAASGDDSVTRYQWDFGDGQLYDGSEIASIFNKPGTYYITLTAYNQFGQSTTGQWITVGPGSFRTFLPRILQPFNSSGGIVALAEPDITGGAGEATEEIPLDEPFVMTPLELPANLSKTEQLLVYVNEARRQFGLRPLTEITQLSAAAQAHTADMASARYTGHVGSDGSAPIERFVYHRYGAAYAGEATAWGFEHPYEAVEFWVNSPSHRPIILNQYATDLGVGYTVDFRAPAVWYWTTEYGDRSGTPFEPAIRPQQPLAGSQFLNSEQVTYSWVWAKPLEAGQYFAAVATVDGEEVLLGETAVSTNNLLYTITTDLVTLSQAAGDVAWRVELRNGSQTTLSSETLAILVNADPTLPTVTPTPLPTLPPLTPTPTSTPVTPIPTPTQPSIEQPPPLATPTPQPEG